ncbi:hypothetical protein [Chitinophaga sp.]|uniref:hypothetical protein n=1 Tax=Chitinophaga sp. TaxID=1869181 RepID=UPI0031D49924
MPIKINREDCRQKYPVLPVVINDDGDWSYPDVYEGYILEGTYNEELINLMTLLRTDHLIFLPVYAGDAWQVTKNELQHYISGLDYINNDIYFTDPGQHILGVFCDSDNLHLSILNEKANECFQSFLKTSKWNLTNCQ